MMKAYTFFRIRNGGAVPDFEIEQCSDEAEAKRYAQRLLARYSCDAVEIWDGSATVRIERQENAA